MEYQIGVFGAGLLGQTCRRQDTFNALRQLERGQQKCEPTRKLAKRKTRLLKSQKYSTLVCSLGGIALVSFLVIHFNLTEGFFITQSKSFHGTLGVSDTKNSAARLIRELADGTTVTGS